MRRCSSAALALRPTDLVAVRLRPCSMFQTTSGFSGRGARPAGVPCRPANCAARSVGEDLDRAAEIGRGLLDHCAQIGEACRGLAGRCRDFGVDRRDAAEVGREGDAPSRIGLSTVSA